MNAFDVRIHAIRHRPDRDARSRSAGMPPGGLDHGRSSPGAWRTVTGPSSSALPARAGTSTWNRGTGVLGHPRACQHQLAGARSRLRCDEMAPGGGAHPRHHCLRLTALAGPQVTRLRGAAPRRSRRAACQLLHPPARGWGQLTLTTSLPRSGRAWTGNGTPRERRSLKHRPEGASRTVPIPPQLARLLRLAHPGFRVRRRWAAVPGCPRRPGQRKPLRPDLAPGPHRGHPGPGRHLAGAPPLRPSPCRAVAVAGLRRPTRRRRGPRRAQRARPARRLCPRHTRLRPDRQPAHRRSPQPQPLAPAGPQEPAHTPESRPSCVRATAGPSGTQLD